jgi:Ca2+-transporting ATPase
MVRMIEARRWHTLDAKLTASQLAADVSNGLTSSEAKARLETHGINDVEPEKARGPLLMLAAQFTDFMIVVLLAAAVISGVVGELRDTIAILVIVLLNAIVGTVQEYRAQRAVAALKRMSAPQARVIRDRNIQTVDARDVVPGDIVVLEAGDIVPADIRLCEATDLRTDESALTGESLTVEKSAAVLEDDNLPLGDRRNLAHKSTSVTRGHAKGIVVATGPATEIGQIAELLRQEKGVRTPLQRRLARFGRNLAFAILGICVIVFLVGLLQGQPALLMFLTAVSLAVAAVPEALPAVVTISLALGARKLAKRRALVRRLPAVETLGSVTFICADKTGTVTENRMSVVALLADREHLDSLPETPDPVWRRFGEALALDNEVQSADGVLTGDPTEIALYLAAKNGGFHQDEILRRMPRVAELAFDEERKCMTTLHRENGHIVAFVKGAPEVLVPKCSAVASRDPDRELDPDAILCQANALARDGDRVLAVAFREFPDLPELSAAAVETELTFLGLAGLADSPRPEAPQAVADCRTAGIVPVLITGDHPGTARHIARSVGIGDDESPVMTGTELAGLTDDEFDERVGDIRVYARVDPEQKIRIVSALQKAGEFVAMTGDGVNDAPALKRAGIGIAMGQRGTDVAREAADMVLLDDNFATIVAAVQEGRRVFDNIRKFIRYTMTSNSGEIWTLLLAPLFGLPIPLLPIHILWINLVTDGLPGLALSAEPAERHVMQRPPRPPEESIFARGMWQHMLWVGLLIGALSIGAQAWGYRHDSDHWQTMVFTTLVIAQLFNCLAIRSEHDALWVLGLTTNPQLLGAVLLTMAAQLAVIYVPALQPIFRTSPLPLMDLAICFGLGAVVLIAVEFEKWLVRSGKIYANAIAK